MKIATVLGTRPEIIRLSKVLVQLDKFFDHKIIHTGQNYDYELNQIFFEDLGLRKPDYFLEAVGLSASDTVGRIISLSDQVLSAIKPDALLVLGDTNSCMAAYAAKRQKIPIFHMEAGNRCFDFRVPEEINRRLIDHLSDVNLVYSDAARQNLLREGLPSDRIIKTGSPMYEILTENLENIKQSNILKKLGLKERDYFVFSAHREENINNPAHFKRIVEILNAIVETYNKKIIFSVHPRTRKKIDEENLILPAQIILAKPFGLFDYVKLQQSSLCVLSDSGSISEESSILKFPAVNIRETHERLEAMDEAAVIMTGLDKKNVIDAITITIAQHQDSKAYKLPADYSQKNTSLKVVRLIASYTDYVNRVVWQK